MKKHKSFQSWKKVIVGTGEFFKSFEEEQNSFFEDLKLVLSKENLSKIAADLHPEDGYQLRQNLYKALMQLMQKYEIPYETAEAYTLRIIYAVLEQLRTVNPEQYEHYFLQEWRDEQDKSFTELQDRMEKMSKDIALFNREQLAIASSGQMDIELRRSTVGPSIGIEFFIVDDDRFTDKFKDLRYQELIYIRGRNREEVIYCVLNELWRLNDKRPIYVVRSLESWNKLQLMNNEGNVYIPWFYAEEITAIENNTNIFVLDENTPVFGKQVIELRPRTRSTLLRCLQDAGMEYSKAYSLSSDTHGLYSQIKKRLYKGEYLKEPSWMAKISEAAKKTCLLIGCWEEIEGDKLIIEHLYGDTYDKFLEEVLPYTKGEDPFLYMVNRNGAISYYLASTENIWSYLNVLPNERIWKGFIRAVFEVINESEDLFTYDSKERLIAQLNGEKLFWSETIRKGMLNTLLIKGAYQNDIETKLALDKLIEKILDCVKTKKQWVYISKFWKEFCEISPSSVLKRLDQEWDDDTGLFSLFENQSKNFIFERNSYIDILWGIEQFLVQKDYFWPAFRWLLKLDKHQYEYTSNTPKDIFEKIFCTWMNYSSLQNADEKNEAVKVALDIDYSNTWNYLYSAVNHNGRSIFGELSLPKYREHSTTRPVTIAEMRKTNSYYIKHMMKHMDFSVERWKRIIDWSSNTTEQLRAEVFDQLRYELNQMSDYEVMDIKNSIRHFIYRHRYFDSASWSISDEILLKYEKFLNEICINTPELEYCYLFAHPFEYPLLNPFPYDSKKNEENEKATQELIKEKLSEFENHGYNLQILAEACSKVQGSTLGKNLAVYWNDGKWDYSVFKTLLEVQEESSIAFDYLLVFSDKGYLPYKAIIEDLTEADYSEDILSKIYRIEACYTKDKPLVSEASDSIKKEFWKHSIHCQDCNGSWTLTECKKYADLNVFLAQMNIIHYEHPLSAEKIFEYLQGVETLPHSTVDEMMRYHVEQLISVMQDAFIDDAEKCVKISHLELYFMGLLEWENMKCFQRVIKQSPELMAYLVGEIFKKDHETPTDQHNDANRIHNMYAIYDKAHFCPTEVDGKVMDDQLKHWVEQYKQLLIDNDQSSLFTSTLGRLFSFSPIGADGHEPCEAVRNVIEQYCDERMISSYQSSVYNRRGIFTPTAGKEELTMAEQFISNARYLEPHYPKTAQIFYGLSAIYKRESERERLEAENGWF